MWGLLLSVVDYKVARACNISSTTMEEESGSGDIQPTDQPSELTAAPLVFVFVAVVIVVSAVSAWITRKPVKDATSDDISESLVDDSRV